MPTSIYLQLAFTILLIVCDVCAQQHRSRSKKSQAFSPASSRSVHKPNIVLILTDDQDVELGSLNFMPKTLRNIRDQGAEFRHAYVTTPMCCPSRSSLLTGMYVHNHQVFTNKDNCSNAHWQATHETRTFATYLSNAGYRTGYFGKYLNKYNGSYIPPGWREWGGLIMNSKYYNYSINMNGKKIKHGFDYLKDYYPDLIANDSITFLRNSKRQYPYKPVMLAMSFPAPHGPEDSAPQYSHLFFNVTTHHTPSYDFAPNPDKQWILKVTNKMEPIHREFTDLLMTKRLQTLQSVDAAVEKVVKELETLGELENTYIIYTSDHGYHLGQFGLIKGKSFPFEFDVRVPFLVRGPGVEPGAVVNEIVLNIDLAPTFLDMAGVDLPSHMDGRSVLPLFVNPKRKKLRWPDTFLIESSGRRETPYLDAKLELAKHHASSENPRIVTSTEGLLSTEYAVDLPINTERAIFNESGEDIELTDDEFEDDEEEEFSISNAEDEGDLEESTNYDIRLPPLNHDFTNGGGTNMFEEVSGQLENQLSAVPSLYGSKLERLAIECLSDHMKLPCQHRQKWYCQNDNGRWRKHKCKLIGQNIPYPHGETYRRCACFTTNGLVYRNFPLHSSALPRRMKRDLEIDTILFGESERHEVTNLSVRKKRDVLSQVEGVMENVQSQIHELRGTNGSLDEVLHKTNLETNAIVDNSAGCIIDRGRVNCSNIVYQNKKSWRQSRHRIESEIQRLKQKLETLKEIKRHLKYTKPAESGESEEIIGNVTDLHNRFDNLNFDEQRQLLQTTRAPLYNFNRRSKKRKKPHHFENDLKSETTTEKSTPTTTTIVKQNMTSTLPKNPHRHHRKHDILISTTTLPDTDNDTLQSVKNSSSINREKDTPVLPKKSKHPQNFCHCEVKHNLSSYEDHLKERQRVKDKKFKKKLKKQKKKEEECHSERMNCFEHDNNHWKTEPLWRSGPFCFCMNANNNTYSCIRTINATHNFLYCEFTTGFVTFYNLRIDPFELHNKYDQLRSEEKSHLRDLLKHMIACKGKNCTVQLSSYIPVKSRTHAAVHSHQSFLKKRRLFSENRRMDDQIGVPRIDRKGNERNSTGANFRATGVRKKRKL